MVNIKMFCTHIRLQLIYLDSTGESKYISKRIFENTISKIRDHYSSNGLNSFTIELEVMEIESFSVTYFRQILDRIISSITGIRLTLVLVTSSIPKQGPWIELMVEYSIKVYYYPANADINELKLYYPQSLRNQSEIYTVIDPDLDFSSFYQNLKSLSFYRNNLLLPPLIVHNTWIEHFDKSDYKIGNWLTGLFDLWFNDVKRPFINIFTEVVNILLGHHIPSAFFGNGHNRGLKIDINGTITSILPQWINQRLIRNNAPNITDISIDHAYKSDLPHQIFFSKLNVSAICKKCLLNNICGGGEYSSRYNSVNSFDNPSFFCKDFILFISHVQRAVFSEFSPNALQSENIECIETEKVLSYIQKMLKDDYFLFIRNPNL